MKHARKNNKLEKKRCNRLSKVSDFIESFTISFSGCIGNPGNDFNFDICLRNPGLLTSGKSGGIDLSVWEMF